MNNSQNDKVAIITGGGGAIALATSHALRQEGYRLALWDNNEDMLMRHTEALAVSYTHQPLPPKA